jgi:hypothetical protein
VGIVTNAGGPWIKALPDGAVVVDARVLIRHHA